MGMKTDFSVRRKQGIEHVKNAAQSTEGMSGIRGLPKVLNQQGFVTRKRVSS
jgi:hypothetical protein